MTDKLDVILTSIFGSGVVTYIMAKWLGKKKEDIEIALNYQEYYGNIIERQEKVIDKLTLHNEECEKLIEQQRINISRLEVNCEKLEAMLREERKEHNKLIKMFKND